MILGRCGTPELIVYARRNGEYACRILTKEKVSIDSCENCAYYVYIHVISEIPSYGGMI